MSRTSIVEMLFITALASPVVYGCECRFPTVREAVEGADFVFRGTLAKIEYLDPERTVTVARTKREINLPRRFRATLNITRVWKGSSLTDTVVVYTREPSGGDCRGFYTQIGTDAVFFARTEPADDHWLYLTNSEGVETKYLLDGWLDVVQKGEMIMVPISCSLTATADQAENTGLLKKLGHGREPNGSK